MSQSNTCVDETEQQYLECVVGGWSDLTSSCAPGNAFVSQSLSGPERQFFYDHSLCFASVFAISRDIHTVAVYAVVLMEHTPAELCELSNLGALLKWVGVPEVKRTRLRWLLASGTIVRRGVVARFWKI